MCVVLDRIQYNSTLVFVQSHRRQEQASPACRADITAAVVGSAVQKKITRRKKVGALPKTFWKISPAAGRSCHRGRGGADKLSVGEYTLTDKIVSATRPRQQFSPRF